MYRIENVASSFIKLIEYDEDTEELMVLFNYGDVIKRYIDIKTFSEFISADSIGAYYNKYIRHNFKKSTKSKNSMEKKTESFQVNLKINVDMIKPEWIFKGEKGRYLNMTFWMSHEKDQFGNNGMIIQQVPTDVYKKHLEVKKEKLKGPILGNGSIYERVVDKEAQPGFESGKMLSEEEQNDLPF